MFPPRAQIEEDIGQYEKFAVYAANHDISKLNARISQQNAHFL